MGKSRRRSCQLNRAPLLRDAYNNAAPPAEPSTSKVAHKPAAGGGLGSRTRLCRRRLERQQETGYRSVESASLGRRLGGSIALRAFGVGLGFVVMDDDWIELFVLHFDLVLVRSRRGRS